MRPDLVIAAGLLIATAATPASALTFYSGFGQLYLEFLEGTGPDVLVDTIVETNAGSSVNTTGAGSATSSVQELTRPLGDGLETYGVEASIDGGTGAPGGLAAEDLFLDVEFLITNLNEQSVQGFDAEFRISLDAEVGIMPDDFAQASVLVTGVEGFGSSAPGRTVIADPLDAMDATMDPFEILASIEGALPAGGSVSYRFNFDLRGRAETPNEPGAEVPLPAAGALMALGIGALGVMRRRRRL